MASYSKKRQKAEEWYIEHFEATQKEIATLFNVTEKTIGNWKEKYGWEKKRLDYHSSPVRIKELLQQELMRIAQGEPAKLNADSVSKLMSALDKLDKKADPIVVQKILKDLDNFISESDPEFAIRCTEFHRQFLIHRINLEG